MINIIQLLYVQKSRFFPLIYIMFCRHNIIYNGKIQLNCFIFFSVIKIIAIDCILIYVGLGDIMRIIDAYVVPSIGKFGKPIWL
jgi:hypothetical protein